jgi:DHA1 family multidrug resistance protein-like MFS transporter
MTPKQMASALILLSCCIGILMMGFGIIVPVFPQRLEAMGLGAETLALMEGGFGLGMFLFSTPLGTLADRIGRKPIVLLSLAGFIITSVVLALVNIPVVFILVRFVEGALISGLMPASNAIVGDVVPAEKQGRWIGFMTTAQSAGFAIGPGIGGILYQAWGFSSPFFITAAAALIASLLALFMLPETLSSQVREEARVRYASRRREKSQKQKKARGMALGQPGLLLVFLPLLIIDFGMTFAYPFVLPQYPFYFEKMLGFSAAQYGVIISAYGGALAVFPMLLGGVSERFSKKLVITVGSILTPIMNVALLFVHQYALLIVATILTGVGSALLIPALSTIYLGMTSDHNRSQIMGIRGTAISFAILTAPLAQALVAPWTPPQVSFAISVAISLVIILLVIVTLKNPQQPEKHDEVKPEALPEIATNV